MKQSQQLQVPKQSSFSTNHKTTRHKSEVNFHPNYDILNEHVKSSFALGFIRGLPKVKKIANDMKSDLQLRRDETYDKVNTKTKCKRLTLLKYGFRTHEKKTNYYLQPLIHKIKEAYGEQANEGSMGVVDLWSDRNVNRLMDALEMTRDNLLIRRMGAEKPPEQQDTNTALTRLQEKKLKDRIIMETLKLSSNETDTFGMKYKLTDYEKIRLERVSKPTVRQLQQIPSQSNPNIEKILEDITDLHRENLDLYVSLCSDIKAIRKNIK